MSNIDLHCHTTASDGKCTPSELIALAEQAGLQAIAITDHDTVQGIQQVLEYSGSVKVIPGVEITCDDPEFTDIHVVGLFIDPHNQELKALLEESHSYREEQKKQTVAKLNELGFNLDFDDIKSKVKGEVGRPHIAKAMLAHHPEKVQTMQQCFDEYLAVGKPGFVKREKGISMKQAVETIHRAGGVSILAHPGVYDHVDVTNLIDFFCDCGGKGMETYYDYGNSRLHSDQSARDALVEQLKQKAKEKGLLMSGGSDFHGRPGQELGVYKIPSELLKPLQQ